MNRIVPGTEAFNVSILDSIDEVTLILGKCQSVEKDIDTTYLTYDGATIVLVNDKVESIALNTEYSGKMENGIRVGLSVAEVSDLGCKLEYSDNLMCWELSGVDGISFNLSRPKGENDFTDNDRVIAQT